MLEALKQVGLSETETRVLAVLLRHDTLPASAVARKADVNRSYCYDVLAGLLEHGFVAKVVVNGEKQWKALPPEQILTYIDEVREQIAAELGDVRGREDEREREIRFYRGKQGIKAVCNNLIASDTTVLGFGTEQKLKEYLPYSWEHILEQIEENKVPYELIATKGEEPISLTNTEMKTFDKEFDTCVEINVYEDKVVFFFWQDDLEAIEIKDEAVADSFRNYHTAFWEKL